jgi:hypothetical protein
MATSAEELSSQAESLKEIVSYFKIDEESMKFSSPQKTKTSFAPEKVEVKTTPNKVRMTLHQDHAIAKKISVADSDFEKY